MERVIETASRYYKTTYVIHPITDLEVRALSVRIYEAVLEFSLFIKGDILCLLAIEWLGTNSCCEDGFDSLKAAVSEGVENHERSCGGDC